jgi:subtilase family serine protease
MHVELISISAVALRSLSINPSVNWSNMPTYRILARRAKSRAGGTASGPARRLWHAAISVVAVAALFAAGTPAFAARAAAAGLGQSNAAANRERASGSVIHLGPNFLHLPNPLSTSMCQATYSIRCYTPVQLRHAYNLDQLYSEGIDGRSRTIVIPIPFGSPTISNDLSVFDAQFGLPNPDLEIVKFGNIPPYDPNNPVRVEWAAGTTFEVEYAHSAAPDAKIVIAETDRNETVGVTGFPELMKAEQSLINAGIGDVILQLFGTAESTFPGFSQGSFASLLGLRYAFKDALAHHVTVLALTGDTGVTTTESDGSTLYPYPVVAWPSSDPLVTSVGGTQLVLDNAGSRSQPDVVWNDGYGATGGGVSGIFARPRYQSSVSGVVGGYRGTPDISMSAAVNGCDWVYLSFGGVGGAGWNLFDGTISATAMFSGIVALADQVAGHRLGLINPALYALGRLAQHNVRSTGIVDITQGNNSFGGVTGYSAAPGYDLASGWGTLNAAEFVPALARSGSMPSRP